MGFSVNTVTLHVREMEHTWAHELIHQSTKPQLGLAERTTFHCLWKRHKKRSKQSQLLHCPLLLTIGTDALIYKLYQSSQKEKVNHNFMVFDLFLYVDSS